MGLGLPVKFFSLIAAALMLQTAVPVNDIIGPVERLTLVSALVIAVTVLWRSNAAKDQQIIAMATTVTEAVVKVLEAVKELRITTDQVGNAMDDLASNLGALPCAMEQMDTQRAKRIEADRRAGHHK